jgi:hypothetical protein
MKQRTLQILYAYWDRLRAGRIAPLRLEIDPSRIGSILPETFLLERTDTAAYRYRLAGTRLCEIFGVELRSSNILDGWSAADRMVLARDLAFTCEEGAATLLTMEASADHIRRVQLEVILLPLMHANNMVGRVIGAMSPMTSPHWLGHDHLRAKRLVRHELLWPDRRPHANFESAGVRVPVLSAGRPVGVAKGDRRGFRVLDGGRKGD